MKKNRKNKFTKIGIVLFVVLIVVFIIYINQIISLFEEFSNYLFPDDNNRKGELFKIVLSIFGALGILFGLYASWKRALAMENGVIRQKEAIEIQSKQIAISRKAQTDERFKNAVEHLGDEKEPIILGGIAELHQIAKENISEYAEIVFNILCSYIRSSANIYNKTADEINTTVIQTIVNNLFKSDKNKFHTYSGLIANLSHTNLLGINLDFTDLSGANLSFCYMPDLKNSNLENADLSRAVFTLSNIINVSLLGAKLFNTTFFASTIKNVNMSKGAELLSTIFLDSELNNVNFDNNSLSGCKYIACDIFDTTFKNAEIVSTSFTGSGLKNIDFSQVKLFGNIDFRATGFINVNMNTIVTQAKFNGCRKGVSYRYSLKGKLNIRIGKKADLREVKMNNSLCRKCETGELTQADFDEIIKEYDKCLEMKSLPGTKIKIKEIED